MPAGLRRGRGRHLRRPGAARPAQADPPQPRTPTRSSTRRSSARSTASPPEPRAPDRAWRPCRGPWSSSAVRRAGAASAIRPRTGWRRPDAVALRLRRRAGPGPARGSAGSTWRCARPRACEPTGLVLASDPGPGELVRSAATGDVSARRSPPAPTCDASTATAPTPGRSCASRWASRRRPSRRSSWTAVTTSAVPAPSGRRRRALGAARRLGRPASRAAACPTPVVTDGVPPEPPAVRRAAPRRRRRASAAATAVRSARRPAAR